MRHKTTIPIFVLAKIQRKGYFIHQFNHTVLSCGAADIILPKLHAIRLKTLDSRSKPMCWAMPEKGRNNNKKQNNGNNTQQKR